MTGGPVVGVVGHRYVVPRPYVDLPVTGTPHAYTDRVAAAGGRPLVLPAGRAVDLLDVVDALVLTGGADLDPALAGTDVGSADEVDRARDEDELALVREAHRRELPLLGVCRGLQVLVVAHGGTLVSDLGAGHRRPGVGHRVHTAPGSSIGRLLGGDCHTTSLHHQAVADPGPAFRVTARADDGVAEAVEWAGPGDWPVLGVQWHPELSQDATGAAVFGWLVAAALRQRSMI
ncbi:gamma-glutamyl-gamma-aminobutyrate hydrolase family protein [Oryzobacter terrae]|uniref:gamma-glutamyl-gamma-aminobutyrate hydrolase family protein n=1 Tax=Oryzobacter terrae TaxID=1620385 RepID=UPI003671FC30